MLIDAPAKTMADVQRPLAAAVPGLDAGSVVATISALSDNNSRVSVLREALAAVVELRDPGLVAQAREVAAVAALAEHDRSVCRIEHLADVAGVSVRTLQRLFDVHVGASPSFVIRRWRIIEAADAARRAAEEGDDWRGWGAVAAELGYADQAHLARDFRFHLGVSPSAYVARNLPPSPG